MVYVSLCQKISQFLPSASKPDLCQEFKSRVSCIAGAENSESCGEPQANTRLLELAETAVVSQLGFGYLITSLLVLPLSSCICYDIVCIKCLLHILDCYLYPALFSYEWVFSSSLYNSI